MVTAAAVTTAAVEEQLLAREEELTHREEVLATREVVLMTSECALRRACMGMMLNMPTLPS
jgi:hypothetical protein